MCVRRESNVVEREGMQTDPYTRESQLEDLVPI